MQAAGDAGPPLYLSFLNPIQTSYMKKTILLIITAGFIFCNANSQITKGNWMVGGSGSFSTNNVSATRFQTTNIEIKPSIGFFIATKLAAGLKFSYISEDLSKFAQMTGSPGLTVHSFLIGPFVRYYFLEPEKMVNFFAEANYSYGTYKSTGIFTISDGKSNDLSLALGSAIYFNSSVAIEFSLGYYSTHDVTYGYNNNGFQLGIGFQIYLEK